jgi:putative aldouronate transport system permease protein
MQPGPSTADRRQKRHNAAGQRFVSSVKADARPGRRPPARRSEPAGELVPALANTGRRVRIHRKFIPLYLMVLPGIAFVIVFNYMPMAGVQIAFKQWSFSKGIWGSPWIGFANFEFLLQGDFWQVVSNTFTITLLRLAFGFPAPIILALLLNELRFSRFKRVVQTISYLPHFMSWIVVIGLMQSMLALDDGVINTIIMKLGGHQVLFMGSTSWFRPLVVGSGMWKEVGWGSIIYLATIAAINPELYEAAIVDGAGRWKRLLHITLPMMVPTMSILLVLNMPGLLSVGIDQIYPMLNPGNMAVGDVVDTYILRLGIGQVRYSETAGIGLIMSVLSTALVLFSNAASKRLGGEGIW